MACRNAYQTKTVVTKAEAEEMQARIHALVSGVRERRVLLFDLCFFFI